MPYVEYDFVVWKIKNFTVPAKAKNYSDLQYMCFLETLTVKNGVKNQLSCLSPLVNLDELTVMNTPVSQEELATIAVLPKLKKFVEANGITEEIIELADIEIKYSGYIERERSVAEKLHRLEGIAIPTDFDYMSMQSLTIEARQKLQRIRPATIGQASRIPGVSPADINVLLIRFGR